LTAAFQRLSVVEELSALVETNLKRAFEGKLTTGKS